MCKKLQYARYIKRLKYKALGILGNRCAHCFKTAKLEFAHKKYTGLYGNSRGQRQRFKDVLSHVDSYVLLCKECHRDYDTE